MSLDYRQEMERALASFEKSIAAMDVRTFADVASWDQYDPLIAKAWTRRMLWMIDALAARRATPREVAALFPNMSELRVKFAFDLWMAKYAGAPQAEREKIAHFYLDLLNAFCVEDPYAMAKNVIHTPAEVEELLKRVRPASPDIARALGRLVSACYHFGFAAYSDMYPSIVYDNYGPYDVRGRFGPGHILAVKVFGNLRCPDLWPETADIPWMHVNILAVYRGVTMAVDSCSHAVYQGDLIRGLTHFSLHVDGVEFPPERIPEVRAVLERHAGDIFTKFQALPLEEKKVVYYHQKTYVYKKIFEFLGKDWRPSEEILAEARGKPLYRAAWPADEGEQRRLMRQILDPAAEFPKELPPA